MGRVRTRAATAVAGGDGLAGHWPAIQPIWEARALALQFQLERSQWWRPDLLERFQLRQAHDLIRHAQATVPFYRRRLAAAAKLPPGQLTMEAFRALPLLSRQEIQAAGPELESTAVPAEHGHSTPIRTSGSTGRPIEVKGTALTSCMGQTLTMRGHLWQGRDFSASSAVIRPPRPGIEPGRHHHWAPLPRTGPGIAIDGRLPIEEIFEALLKADPVYLQCHPYVVHALVQRSEETGARPTKLREVRTYGEALDPWLREACREVWGVEIIDNYSAEEFGIMALQCPESTNLHVQAESVLVEVLDETGKACGPGETGRIVVTALLNYATPLIRSELGDIVRLGEPCACGRGLPVLEQVLGRHSDLLVYPSGEKQFPLVNLHSLVPEIPIRQYQLVQQSLDRVRLNLIVARPLSEAEEGRITETVVERLRHPFAVSLAYMDEIPRLPSGKFTIFRSELASSA